MTFDFKFYLSLFLRRLPWFVLLSLVGLGLGLGVAAVLPPTYVAEARLLVESEQIPGDLAESTVRVEATEQLQIIQQRIQTRAELIELANRLGIYEGVSPQPTPDDIVKDLRERIRIVTTGGEARGQRQATIVTVSFADASAQLAARVTNEVVTMILSEDVALRTGVSSDTVDFFTQEVERLDREVALRSERILAFKQANMQALPDSLDYRRNQQAVIQERLLQIERDLSSLTERRTRLEDVFSRTGQVSVATETRTAEARQLQEARDALTRALAVYSPQHPNVRLLESQVAALERIVAAQAADAAPEPAETETPLSAFDLQVADMDAQIVQLTDEKTRLTATLEELTGTIDATPGNAIALETLERDYANVRQQYDTAVARKAQAETGDLIEALSKGQKISIIEQAEVPRLPDSPNRPLIAAAGLGGGIMLGLALILLIEMTNTAIRRPSELTTRLGITPFATVPLMREPGETQRRSKPAGGGAMTTVALIALPAALVVIHMLVMPIDDLIFTLSDALKRAIG